MEQIVVGLDGSKSANAAVEWAAREARRKKSEVLVVQSWTDPLFLGPSLSNVWVDPNVAERAARAEFDAEVATFATAASTVVVVRDDDHDDGSVVVGVDGSASSRDALRWAAEAARVRGCPLRVVMAWTYLLPQGEHGPEPFRATYTEADAWRVLGTIVDDELGTDPDVEVDLQAGL